MHLSLVLPCYCEQEVLPRTLPRILEHLATWPGGAELILVDDASPDRTWAVLEQLLTGPTPVPVVRLRHPRNRGRGAAVRTGLERATGEVAGFIDLDLEVPLQALDDARRRLDAGADLVVGWRRYVLRDPRPDRVLYSIAYRRLAREVLELPLHDTECGMKLFRRESLAAVIERVEAPGWFWDTELVYRATRAGLRLAEIPTPFHRDPAKASTVRPLRDGLRQLRALGRLWWQR